MLTVFHGYVPEVWDAYFKRGLISGNDGIRFCQTTRFDETKKFNVMAAKGSDFYNMVKDLQFPLYIDRLQGGTYIDSYPYDQNLISEYKELLGEKFWGFQMHEWLSNYMSDIKKLSGLDKKDWNVENITAHIKKAFPYPFLFLESMTAEEMAHYGKPESYEEFYANMTDVYKKRLKVGELIPVDSALLMYAFEISSGAKRLLPEVGAQTSDARVQICYARGMTRKEDLHFGVYYEPWGRPPKTKDHDYSAGRPDCTACCYHREQKNEWGIGGSADFPFHTEGPNGGSSRSLQKRIFLYSYLSGAEFLSEEWGVCNVFYDWHDFELSPYGLVKKYLVDFMKKYPDVGDPVTPIGVIIPKDLPMLENVFKKPLYKPPFPYKTEAYTKVLDGVSELFAKTAPMLGNENITMVNCVYPDALDLLNDGFGDISRYDYLVDLTSDSEFARKHNNICEIKDVKDILRRTLPCYVEGDIHWLVNKRTGGGHYLTVFNNGGVMRIIEDGEYTLPEADLTVSATFKGDASPILCEGNATLTKDGDSYKITVKAGDFAFIKF